MRKPTPYLALVVAFVTLGGAAYSAIPDAQSVIHGCYDARGTLRVIDETDACEPAETSLNWNQQGPPGPPGAQGPGGPPGGGGAPAAYAHGSTGSRVIDTRNEGVVVASLTLPAGDYAIFAKLDAYRQLKGLSCATAKDPYQCRFLQYDHYLKTAIVDCKLRADKAADGATTNLVAGVGALLAEETMTAMLVHRLSGDQNEVTLACGYRELPHVSYEKGIRVSNVRLVAIRVNQAGVAEAFKSLTAKAGKAPRLPKAVPLRRALRRGTGR